MYITLILIISQIYDPRDFIIHGKWEKLCFMICMGLCVSSLLVYLMMIVRKRELYFIIFTIKSEVWPIMAPWRQYAANAAIFDNPNKSFDMNLYCNNCAV